MDRLLQIYKITWNGNSGASCYIMNDDTSLFEVNKVQELMKGSSGIMHATKKESSMSISHKLIVLNG